MFNKIFAYAVIGIIIYSLIANAFQGLGIDLGVNLSDVTGAMDFHDDNLKEMSKIQKSGGIMEAIKG